LEEARQSLLLFFGVFFEVGKEQAAHFVSRGFYRMAAVESRSRFRLRQALAISGRRRAAAGVGHGRMKLGVRRTRRNTDKGKELIEKKELGLKGKLKV